MQIHSLQVSKLSSWLGFSVMDVKPCCQVYRHQRRYVRTGREKENLSYIGLLLLATFFPVSRLQVSELWSSSYGPYVHSKHFFFWLLVKLMRPTRKMDIHVILFQNRFAIGLRQWSTLLPRLLTNDPCYRIFQISRAVTRKWLRWHYLVWTYWKDFF